MRICITLLFTLACAGSALAQSLIDINELIPPEYYDIPTADFGAVVSELAGTPQAMAESQCRSGFRIGDRIGRSLAAKLNPSCDELLLPMGAWEENEWAVPQVEFSATTKPAILCHYLGYAAAFEKTVLNTSLNCAKILSDSLVLSFQIEYNRCYVATAKLATKLKMTFAGGQNFITGDYVLIPRDSEAWDEFVGSLVTMTTPDGSEQKSAYMIQACRLGTTHAQQRRSPVNFLNGTPISQ